MSFGFRVEEHEAIVSLNGKNQTLCCKMCGTQLQHRIAENEDVSQGEVTIVFSCPTSIFHQIGGDRYEVADYDLVCCDGKIPDDGD